MKTIWLTSLILNFISLTPVFAQTNDTFHVGDKVKYNNTDKSYVGIITDFDATTHNYTVMWDINNRSSLQSAEDIRPFTTQLEIGDQVVTNGYVGTVIEVEKQSHSDSLVSLSFSDWITVRFNESGNIRSGKPDLFPFASIELIKKSSKAKH